jgi:hypothetical protein
MNYEGGPVLMAGEDANHDGASVEYEFEVVSEHDPERLKNQVKALMVDLIANDPTVRSMLQPKQTTKRMKRNGVAALFGIDN